MNYNSLKGVEIPQSVGVMKLETNRKFPVKTIKKPLCSLQESASAQLNP